LVAVPGRFNFIREFFVYPRFALRIAVKSPQRGQAGAAKAKRGLVTESLPAASTSGGNALFKSKVKIQNSKVLLL
jgi:hypothetical protein